MLLDTLEQKGVHLDLDGCDLRYRVRGGLSPERRQWLKDHKPELLIELRARRSAPPLSEQDRFDLAEAREERSAICEYDGGLSREEADIEASKIRAWAVLVAMPASDPRPPRWITMICTGNQDQARRNAEGTFTAQRVIDIREGTT